MTNGTRLAPLRRPAFLIFAAALILRLIFILILEPAPDFTGGDANWYMKNGRDLVKFGKTLGPLDGRVLEIHAGATYVKAVDAAVTPRGAVLIDQLKGMQLGQLLAWYLQRGHEIAPG